MKQEDLPEAGPLSSSLGVGWGLSGGESAGLAGVSVLAADGIENIIRVLENLEDEKITGVDFVELSACSGGCVGGILTVENPFLARTRLKKIQSNLSPSAQPPEPLDEKRMLFDHPIKFCEVLSLAEDFGTAMELLAQVDEIEQQLYGMDCGACGAPSCRALATDIAQGRASVEDCIYIQRERHAAKS